MPIESNIGLKNLSQIQIISRLQATKKSEEYFIKHDRHKSERMRTMVMLQSWHQHSSTRSTMEQRINLDYKFHLLHARKWEHEIYPTYLYFENANNDNNERKLLKKDKYISSVQMSIFLQPPWLHSSSCVTFPATFVKRS